MNRQQCESFRSFGRDDRAERSFRRADWNGDGKLSFEEFASPVRASFERADRQSTGAIVCGSKGAASPTQKSVGRRGRRGSRSGGSFCSRDDLNRDGKVTRAELDAALKQQFAAAAKGEGGLTRDRFAAMQTSHGRHVSARAFDRLDRDHNGALSPDEFAASQQRTFARLDKNGDGTITRDEMASSQGRYSGRGSSRRS